jgi:hypothetical protein
MFHKGPVAAIWLVGNGNENWHIRSKSTGKCDFTLQFGKTCAET